MGENPSGEKEKEKPKAKSNMRMWSKSLNCPERRCPGILYNFVVRENLVDLSEPLVCPTCKKEIKKAMVEACTDELTAEESSRLLPKA